MEVLRRFGMKPHPGVRLTLVTPTLFAPYSGMIPGFVSGFYSLQDCHIDLCRLARFANARVVLSAARSIDASSQTVFLNDSMISQDARGRPGIKYDVLSINVGITPSTNGIPGVAEYTIPVKPISSFATRLENILDKFTQRMKISDNSKPYGIIVVGGGAGGVELGCALHYRLEQIVRKEVSSPMGDTMSSCFSITIVSKGKLLRGLHDSARKRMLRLLKERNISLYEMTGVDRVEEGVLHCCTATLAFDDCLWCTQAKAPEWFQDTDLKLDSDGYVLVDEYLRVDGGHGNVFAAGDCVTMSQTPRPKAGVYAVRAGPIIADNIERKLSGMQLRAWYPQESNLNLIACGNQYALMAKQWFTYDAAFLWSWKDRIDRAFMKKYGSGLDSMKSNMQPRANQPMEREYQELLEQASMRCGGCGSKVGSTILTSVLESIQKRQGTVIEWGDDAAILSLPKSGHSLIQTLDFFKCPMQLQDPYTFGYISAVHAMSDCYAMNGTPTSALALAVLPFSTRSKMKEQLHHLMSGAVDALAEAGCSLVGGHTSEGMELSMGFSVTGEVPSDRVWRKEGMRIGDDIILIKPLGTGVLLAAAEEGLPVGEWFPAVKDIMCQSNRAGQQVLQKYSITACTDVTGFGLGGHLLEMCKASRVRCQIEARSIPVLPGVHYALSHGAKSSLAGENEQLTQDSITWDMNHQDSSMNGILCDPQTSGGLLCSIDPSQTEDCLYDLSTVGFAHAARIGQVIAGKTGISII